MLLPEEETMCAHQNQKKHVSNCMCEWKKLSQYPVRAGLDCITWTKIFSHVSKDDLEPIDFLCVGLEGENSTEVKNQRSRQYLLQVCTQQWR